MALFCSSLSHACAISTSYKFDKFDVYFDGVLMDVRSDKGVDYLTYDVKRVHKGHMRRGMFVVKTYRFNESQYNEKGLTHRVAFEYSDEQSKALRRMKNVQVMQRRMRNRASRRVAGYERLLLNNWPEPPSIYRDSCDFMLRLVANT